MKRFIGLLLVAEGFLLGLDALQGVRLPWAAADAVGLAVVVARGLVSVIEFAAGLMLLERRPPGASLGIAALVLSAGLWALELGAGLAPGNTFPSLRWPTVWTYWLVASILIVILHRARSAARG